MNDEPYSIRITRRARKDIETLSPRLRRKLRDILVNQVAPHPRRGKRLVGELSGYRSLHLTHRDRIVYRIDEENRTVFILRARTHYGQ